MSSQQFHGFRRPASARRLLSFLPADIDGAPGSRESVNENPDRYVTLTEVGREYGNPWRDGFAIRIRHVVLDSTERRLDDGLEETRRLWVGGFPAVKGQEFKTSGRSFVLRVRVRPQATVEARSGEVTFLGLRRAIQAVDLDGLARVCDDGRVFERTELDRLADALLAPEILASFLPERIGRLERVEGLSWRVHHAPFIRNEAGASYPRPAEPVDPDEPVDWDDNLVVYDYARNEQVQSPEEFARERGLHPESSRSLSVDGREVRYEATSCGSGRVECKRLRAFAWCDRFLLGYSGWFIPEEGFDSPEALLACLVRSTCLLIERHAPAAT